MTAGVVAAFLALFLPTASVLLWVRCFWGSAQPGAWALALAYSYTLGLLLSTVLLRVWDFIGLGVSVSLSLAFWAVLGLAALWFRRRCLLRLARAMALPWRGVSTASLCVGSLLLALIGVRLISLALELWWQPVFAWDAWTTWTLRARVWAEYGALVPFMSVSAWLEQASPVGYPLDAAHYPLTVSLITTWMLLVLTEPHAGLMHLPWLGAWLALLLGVYGHARYYGLPGWLALVLIYVLASLPLLGMHVALAGYADLWMALVLLLGGLAWWRWLWQGQAVDFWLGLGLLLWLPLLKIEGWVWLLPFVAAWGVARVPRRFYLITAVGGLLLLAGWLSGGVQLSHVPIIGTLHLTPSLIAVGESFQLQLGFNRPALEALIRHLFLWGQWHLLWYGLLPGAVLLMLASVWQPTLRAASVTVFALWGLLLLLFLYTHASMWVISGTAVNRLLLHSVPLASFFVVWGIWHLRHGRLDANAARHTSP
ncbi:hypothetical protein [Thiorhodospira sibirica]|uniref:hypothetical protein n=1 Tax=Thiorhodospira sibirica TaxID=154347 RepID=UPI00022C4006|nr:hypothetical protein [Thiorhodospira sibirica]